MQLIRSLLKGWDGGAAGVVGGLHVLCGNAENVRGVVGERVSQRVMLLERRCWSVLEGAWLVMNRAWLHEGMMSSTLTMARASRLRFPPPSAALSPPCLVPSRRNWCC
jgi:hypothetical protein